MAFGFLTKAVNAIGKVAGKVVSVVTPIVKIAQPILRPVYETAVPSVVRKGIRVVATIKPIANFFRGRNDEMNNIETAARQIVEIALRLKELSGLELALGLVPIMLQLKQISDAFNGVPKSEWVPQLREALDNMVGDEPNALIGPGEHALISLSIPYVGVEAVSDLMFTAGEKALLAEAESE